MKQIFTFGFILIFSLSLQLKAQQWQWARTVATGVSATQHNNIEPDGQGNFYLGVNSGVGTCLIKFDGQGNELWRKCINGSVVINGLAANATNVFVTGSYSGTFSAANNTLTSTGQTDGFLLRLDYNGNFTWARTFGGPGVDEGGDLVLDSAMNVHVTGNYADTANFDQTIVTCSCTSSVFLAKYSPQGNLINIKWSNCIWSPSSFATGKQIVLDKDMNTYLLGTYSYFQFDTTEVSGGGGPYDIWYIAKLDAANNVVWAHKTIDQTVQRLYELALDSSQDLIVNGYNSWTIGGTSNTAKLSSSTGSVVWDSGSAYYCPGDRAITEGVAVQNSSSYIFGVNYLGINCSPGRMMRLLAKYGAAGQTLMYDSVQIAMNIYNFDIIRIDNNAFVVTGIMDPGTQAFGTHSVTAYNDPKLFLARFDDNGAADDIKKIESPRFSVFPNPTDGMIGVKHSGAVTISLRDITGQQVLLKVNSVGNEQLELSGFAPGVYFLEMRDGERAEVVKVVKW